MYMTGSGLSGSCGSGYLVAPEDLIDAGGTAWS